MVSETSLQATGSIHFDVIVTADGIIAASHGGFVFFFQVYEGIAYPRDTQVHRALFWAESFKGGEVNDFLDNLSVDDVFRIAIV